MKNEPFNERIFADRSHAAWKANQTRKSNKAKARSVLTGMSLSTGEERIVAIRHLVTQAPHLSVRQAYRLVKAEAALTSVKRFAIASNRGDSGNLLSPRQGDFYVLDLLTQEPAEKDITKGWFRKLKTVQAAVDKMNAADNGGPYVKLDNGYVEVKR